MNNDVLHVYDKVLAGVYDKSCMKINSKLLFFIPFSLLETERHKLPLKLNMGKVVAEKHKMFFILIIITIEDSIADLTFRLHLGHGAKPKPNAVFLLYITGKIHDLQSCLSPSPTY